ncbi:hypothetical protein BASA61_009590 [Batrachochytrium salamandrivorans]|nr:hypothetical protein BASA62_004215 [Batrachochytrium salamandrivorans]KAH6580578.1 hypothetical protein BASA61_009590 [Batrachochytrium salamandrivorans]
MIAAGYITAFAAVFAASAAVVSAQVPGGMNAICGDNLPSTPPCIPTMKCARPDGVGADKPGICVLREGSVASLGGACGGFSSSSPRCYIGLVCKAPEVADMPGVCVAAAPTPQGETTTAATATATAATATAPVPASSTIMGAPTGVPTSAPTTWSGPSSTTSIVPFSSASPLSSTATPFVPQSPLWALAILVVSNALFY